MPTKIFDDTSGGGGEIEAGIKRASQYAPLEKTQLSKILAGYGLKVGTDKGMDDDALYKKAVTAVLAWRAKQTAAAKKAAAPPAAAPKPAAKPAATGTPASKPIVSKPPSSSYYAGGPARAPAHAGGASGFLPNTSISPYRPPTPIVMRAPATSTRYAGKALPRF